MGTTLQAWRFEIFMGLHKKIKWSIWVDAQLCPVIKKGTIRIICSGLILFLPIIPLQNGSYQFDIWSTLGACGQP